MSSITVVLLAAGQSRRMGEVNKLLLPVCGAPMITSMARNYLAVADELIVVTGHEAARVGEALKGLPVSLVYNPDYAQGQAHSVAAGLRAAKGSENVLVALGDQPLIRPRHISALFDAHLAAGGAKISLPWNGNQRGNPLIIPGPLLPRLLADAQNPGCGRFTRANPDLVTKIPLTDPAYYRDVDTPDAYDALKKEDQTTEVA
ncbi:MAG: nucleotidyltransferase family protein [Pseudomonadota bacterium]